MPLVLRIHDQLTLAASCQDRSPSVKIEVRQTTVLGTSYRFRVEASRCLEKNFAKKSLIDRPSPRGRGELDSQVIINQRWRSRSLSRANAGGERSEHPGVS